MAIIKLNNQSISAITSLPAAIPTGALVHIKTQSTASSVSSVSFVNGSSDVVFDNTYKYYIVRGEGIRMDTSGQNFVIKFSENTGSSYSDSDGVEKFNSAKSGATGNNLQYRSAARITGQGFTRISRVTSVRGTNTIVWRSDVHFGESAPSANPSLPIFAVLSWCLGVLVVMGTRSRPPQRFRSSFFRAAFSHCSVFGKSSNAFSGDSIGASRSTPSVWSSA